MQEQNKSKKKVWIIFLAAVLALLAILITAAVLLAGSTAIPERFHPEESGETVTDKLIAAAVSGKQTELTAAEAGRLLTGCFSQQLNSDSVTVEHIFLNLLGENESEFCVQLTVKEKKLLLSGKATLTTTSSDGRITAAQLQIKGLHIGKLPVPAGLLMSRASKLLNGALPEGMTLSGDTVCFDSSIFPVQMEKLAITATAVQLQVPSAVENALEQLRVSMHIQKDSFLWKQFSASMQDLAERGIQSSEDVSDALARWDAAMEGIQLDPYSARIMEDIRSYLNALLTVTGAAANEQGTASSGTASSAS